ncbi:hypothetical protein SN15_01790 [Stenotrophomonas maltophilia]|nr:hypothetical protein SN15_01790 [Stenotrophomonas maltophilia]
MNEKNKAAAALLDDSLFISDRIHVRDVELPDGQKHKFHFRELPAAEFHVFLGAQRDDNQERQADSWARLIAKAVVTPDGELVLSLDRARALKFSVQAALVNEIREVNSYQGKATSPDEAAPSGSDTSSL